MKGTWMNTVQIIVLLKLTVALHHVGLGRLAQHQALRYTCSKWRHLHWEVGELAKGGPAPFNSVHLMKRMVGATKAMVHINHKLAVQTMNFWSFLFASPILLTIEF